MPIHSFAVNTGQIGSEQFNAIAASFRSDVEQRHTQIAIHNPDSADLRTARRLASEIINVSGAEVVVYIRTDNADYDRVWDEDPDPTYWNAVPMKGYFKPTPIEAELKKWGADVENKLEIIFDHYQLFQEFDERMLRVGDVIKVPYNAATKALDPKNYRITNAFPSGNFRYHWLYFTCQAELLTADITVRPEQDMPVEEQIPINGGYRESL